MNQKVLVHLIIYCMPLIGLCLILINRKQDIFKNCFSAILATFGGTLIITWFNYSLISIQESLLFLLLSWCLIFAITLFRLYTLQK